MKKLLTIIMLAIVTSYGTANAQHINWGIKGGVNIANLSPDYNPKSGLLVGLLAHIHLSKQVALQPEIFYSNQGARYTTAGVETKLKLHYVAVPLLFQYMFDNGFRVQAGPQVSFLMGAQSETNLTNSDTQNNLNNTDVALSVGAGYVQPSSGFGIDVRYNAGLTNIKVDKATKLTNNVFQLSVFYIFKHHRN